MKIILSLDSMGQNVSAFSALIPGYPITYYGKRSMKLGEGTYGIVREYINGPFGDVAVKAMHYDSDLGLKSSQIREISIMVILKHPNVVSIIDASIDPILSEIYVVMPLAKMNLKTFILNNHVFEGKSMEETKKSIAYQIINGVNYCLSKGILNRDIKPQNILVYEGNFIKLTDFGLSRPFMCSFDSGVTNIVYTIWYRAPEVLFGFAYGTGADIWAVGCVLYELYTGAPLFPGDSENEMIGLFGNEFGRLEEAWPGIVRGPKWRSSLSREQMFSKIDHKVKDPVMKEIIFGMLEIDPSLRTPLRDVIKNPYFNSVRNPSYENTDDEVCLQILQNRYEFIPTTLSNSVTQPKLQVLFDWLFSVGASISLRKQSVYLAIDLMKYFLYKNANIAETEIQLYGCACLDIAIKMVEVGADRNYEDLDQMVSFTKNTYTAARLLDATIDVVRTLGFNLIHPTSMDFFTIFANKQTPAIKGLGQTILKIVTVLGFYKYTAEDLALGCLYLSNTFFHQKFLATASATKFINEFLEIKVSPALEKILDIFKIEMPFSELQKIIINNKETETV